MVASDPLFVLTGSLNRPSSDGVPVRGQGVSVLRLDPASGTLHPVSVSDRIDNPTFVAGAADGRTLYVTSEVETWDEGLVSAYRLDPATGQLHYIDKQPSRGGAPAYLSLHPSGNWLFAANYLVEAPALRPAQAVVVFPIEADGGVGPAVASASHSGHGPVAGRQDAPHPHCALASPDGRFVLVADLGLDQIMVYPFDVQTGAPSAPARRWRSRRAAARATWRSAPVDVGWLWSARSTAPYACSRGMPPAVTCSRCHASHCCQARGAARPAAPTLQCRRITASSTCRRADRTSSSRWRSTRSTERWRRWRTMRRRPSRAASRWLAISCWSRARTATGSQCSTVTWQAGGYPTPATGQR